MLLPAKKVGPRARGRWDELVGGIVKERKRLCWYWCSRLPDLLLSECGCGGCNEREDDHEPVERASVHCLGPPLGLRIELLSPATCSWVQQEAARRAGSLADNTELDGEWLCPASQRRELIFLVNLIILEVCASLPEVRSGPVVGSAGGCCSEGPS